MTITHLEKVGEKKWKGNFRYYIKEKKNVADAQPVMQFARSQPYLWSRMKKVLSIRRLIKINASDVTSVSRFAQ